MYLFVQVCSLLLCCRKSEDTAKGCVDIFLQRLFTRTQRTYHTKTKKTLYRVSGGGEEKLNNTKQNKKGMIVCAYLMNIRLVL